MGAGRRNERRYLGRNAAVSEWPPPRVAQAPSAVVARRLKELGSLWRTGASLRRRFASEGESPYRHGSRRLLFAVPRDANPPFRRTCETLLVELVQLELLAQGIAVDAKDIGRLALVALGVLHHDFEQRLFHFVQHNLVDTRYLFAVQVVEILLHRALHARGDRAFAILGHAAIRSSTWVAKNARVSASCSATVSTRLTALRNSAPPTRPLLYQEMCLRATRTPVCSP